MACSGTPWPSTISDRWEHEAACVDKTSNELVNLKYETNNENEVINVKMKKILPLSKKIMKIFKNTKNIGQG